MAPKSKKPQVTSTGDDVPAGVARVAFAQRALGENSYTKTVDMIVKQFAVHRTTAERDIRRAQVLIAEDAEAERPLLRARETQRLNRIANKAEDQGEFQAAVAASRGIGKMNGIEHQTVAIATVSPEQHALLGALVMTPHQRQQRIAELRARLIPTVAKPDSDEPEDADE